MTEGTFSWAVKMDNRLKMSVNRTISNEFSFYLAMFLTGVLLLQVMISPSHPAWFKWTLAVIIVAIVVRLLMWTFSVR
jgi:putative flippase GtrA